MPASPRWKTALAKAIDGIAGGPAFQFATLDANSIPRVRSLIHRGFFEAKAAPHLPLIFTTTDIRTPKVAQLLAQPTVEAVYWIADSGEQYRVIGRISIIPAPAHPLYTRFGPTHGLALTALKNEGVDWETERTKMFDSMSGHMKTSWCRPIPRTKLEGGYEEAKKWPQSLPKLGEGTDQEKHFLQIALANFALVFIDPVEVDYGRLWAGFRESHTEDDVQEGRREQWVEEIVVP